MRYNLSQQELSVVSERLASLPPRHISLDNDNLREAGSTWTKEHMDALRVAPLDDLPLSRFFPPDYIPTDTDPDFVSLASQVTALSEDDIRSISYAKVKKAPAGFWTFFGDLSQAITTKDIDTTGSLHCESSYDDLSGSEDGYIGEQISRQCLASLMRDILWHESLGKVAEGWELFTDPSCISCKIPLGTSGRVKVRNCGCIALRAWDSSERLWAMLRVPLVSYKWMLSDFVKATSRQAGEQSHRTGNPEFNWDTFSQEVAELLGQAMKSCKRMHGRWQDQDAWVLSIHGTELRLITTRFREGYLRQVNSPAVAPNEYLVVFRSCAFNLKLDEGRIQAVRAIVALLRWIKSGNSQQAGIRMALDNPRAGPEPLHR